MWLATAGGVLLLLAVATFAFLLVRVLSGYVDWPPTSDVATDGAAHRVDVEPGERFHVWVWGGDREVVCTVTEAESGEPVALRGESGAILRDAGAVPYMALFSGRPQGGQVDVVCPVGSVSPVYVDGLNQPVVLDFLGPWCPLPLALAASGGVLLVIAAAARLLR